MSYNYGYGYGYGKDDDDDDDENGNSNSNSNSNDIERCAKVPLQEVLMRNNPIRIVVRLRDDGNQRFRAPIWTANVQCL